mmetsp:Transcript_21799/g.39102  ORF Transcript_21799/g.39102 Transcript_21799/m.39102 type:complete len:307 (-) Transcript_21799:332-1252(-)|eukprot:CAMPEP_0197649310 /NCGR_PEP_ID=MMETSP1338-20131121/28276_1 /TAXON_ID=43686 ORGANISM="Pelagodinium beii, Strain RCC1491" /NCGR_SAMPLE_ID=MMETSP1338 /ASSEMBLY_ACC=CAM_ASM_000754 /LENGTH=306 /DNA_ID=CAMNT_0043223467 /DNA_START=56 /DNA_END=976 /DNA_ORIENTATION=+
MADFTYDKVPDLTGKKVLITGANTGLGFALAADFIHRTKCEQVIMACRSKKKADDAIAELGHDSRVLFLELDLADLTSVRKAAEELQKQVACLDILVLNAGLLSSSTERAATKDDFETTMGVCHLGHFLFTALVWPLLLKSSGARIVPVSSVGHTWTKTGLDLDDLSWEKRKFDPYEAYFQAKLANIYFTKELARRTEAAGLKISAVSLSPGFGRSELYRGATGCGRFIIYRCVSEENAKLSINTMRAATDQSLENGGYLTPKRMNFYGPPVIAKASALSDDKDIAEKLWTLSEQLVGHTFEVQSS